jgi:hypothetical protein
MLLLSVPLHVFEKLSRCFPILRGTDSLMECEIPTAEEHWYTERLELKAGAQGWSSRLELKV